MTFDEFEKLIVGKRIIAIEHGESLYKHRIGIESFTVEGNIRVSLYGAADYAMIEDVDIIDEDGKYIRSLTVDRN